jgi:anti-anti-sigma factor
MSIFGKLIRHSSESLSQPAKRVQLQWEEEAELRRPKVPFLANENNTRESVTLRCHGRIVRGEETKLLCAVLRRKVREITLDLREVTEIDAAGIGALVSLQASGIYLTLANPTPTVREVLRLTKLDSVFEIVEAERPSEIAMTAEPLAAVAS